MVEKKTSVDLISELKDLRHQLSDLMESENRRKQAEALLRQERDFAESLIETIRAIVLVLDTEGRIVRFNSFLEKISGYQLEEVKGKLWFDVFIPDRERERLRALFSKAPPSTDAPEDMGAEILRLNEDLCALIRAGEADHGPRRAQVMDHVRQTLIEKLEIANPRMVARAQEKYRPLFL